MAKPEANASLVPGNQIYVVFSSKYTQLFSSFLKQEISLWGQENIKANKFILSK